MAEKGVEVEYKFGTMIEVPRAALTAGEIAEYGAVLLVRHQRPDADDLRLQPRRRRRQVPAPLRGREILPANPFQQLDTGGRAHDEMAVKNGRAARPDLEVGICGEHGGDPSSIEFCHQAGLNYVTCSPFRVPVARLAAAQAALASTAERDR